MNIKMKRPSISSIATVGYARRGQMEQFDYIGWTKETAFDLQLVYRVDLENIHAAHNERYKELQDKCVEYLKELDNQREQIRFLEQYISSRQFLAEDELTERWVEPNHPAGIDQMCLVNPLASRCCELGTRSCVIHHVVTEE